MVIIRTLGNLFSNIKGFSEIIFGEIIVKSPFLEPLVLVIVSAAGRPQPPRGERASPPPSPRPPLIGPAARHRGAGGE